jgi:hypothetical protein
MRCSGTLQGLAIAEAVSRRLPNAAAWVGHMGFVMDKVELVQIASEYFGFPSQFSFHQMLHTHLSSVARTIGQLVADVRSGLRLTPLHETKKKNCVLQSGPHSYLHITERGLTVELTEWLRS